MDIDILVELADNLIFTKTRQDLTSLQKEVLNCLLYTSDAADDP